MASTRHRVTRDLYAPPEYADQSWRSFGMDTEAGRLLNKLYAGSLRKPTINYPPVRTRKKMNEENKPTFIPGGGNVGVNARAKTKKDTSSLFVPKVGMGKKQQRSHAIDLITKRKPKQEIIDQRKEANVQRNRYRPPHRKEVATDSQKRLLQAHFQFKGGKILPETGTMQPIEGHLPLQLVSGKPSQARKRAAAVKVAAEAAAKEAAAADPESTRLLQLEKDFEEVMDEIDERKKFLDEMLQFGSKEVAKHKDTVMAEIGGLVRRAKDLDKEIKKMLQ